MPCVIRYLYLVAFMEYCFAISLSGNIAGNNSGLFLLEWKDWCDMTVSNAQYISAFRVWPCTVCLSILLENEVGFVNDGLSTSGGGGGGGTGSCSRSLEPPSADFQ